MCIDVCAYEWMDKIENKYTHTKTLKQQHYKARSHSHTV